MPAMSAVKIMACRGETNGNDRPAITHLPKARRTGFGHHRHGASLEVILLQGHNLAL